MELLPEGVLHTKTSKGKGKGEGKGKCLSL